MNKKYCAWDLETIRDDSAIELLPEVVPNGTLKKKEKIKADIAKKKREQVSKMGLNPSLNMICCFGWASENQSGHILLEEATHEAEAELILIIEPLL